MRAITLWEPYASLVALGYKRIETRSWATSYRGTLLIHAAKHPLSYAQQELLSYLKSSHNIDLKNFHFGCVVATCNLVNCVAMSDSFIKSQSPLEIAVGDWQVGRVAWIFSDIKIVNNSISVRGGQRLWIPSNEVMEACGFQPKIKQLTLFE